MFPSPSRPASLAAAFATFSCASLPAPPPAVTVERARRATTLSAALRVRLDGPELRARARALVAFRRPDALRIEVPGPAGLRLLAVVRGDRLLATFPAERAFYEGSASPEEMDALLGVALSAPELMDLLVGTASPRLRGYRARWGASLPRKIDATLPDGARLAVTLEDAELDAAVPEAAFADPPHPGYRPIDAAEARGLWSGRSS
jgi:hypothetical protein